MMRRWWHYLLLGTSAWLCFMVWRFPASIAYGMAAESLATPVQLAGLSGSLWHGSAQQLQYQNRVVASPDWRLSAWGLLLGRLDGHISLTQGEGYLAARVTRPLSGGEVSLSAIEGRMPLALLQPYLSMVPLPLDGELSLKLDALVVDPAGRLQQADGRIVWHQAGVLAPQSLQLGDLQMTLRSADGGGIEGAISDSGGPLQLRATLALAADGGYQLKGTVTPDKSASPQLRNYLAMLGKADSQGGYPLQFSGRL